MSLSFEQMMSHPDRRILLASIYVFGLYDAIAACGKAGFSPRVGQEATQMISTLSLVAAGLGTWVKPIHLAGLSWRKV